MKTPKPLLALRMVFPLAASLIVLLLGEGIARGSLSADVFASFIFPHIGAYLLAWLLLFLVWLLLDWVFRCPPLSTLGMAVLGCAPCAVNFYTLQLRGEPFLPWDLTQVSEAAGVASAAGLKIQPSMVVTIIVVLVLMAGSFFLYRGRHKQRWLPRLAGSAATAAALCLLVFGVYLQPAVTQVLGITPDAWMQDRYYRYYGVITGFMTNLTNLEISKPEEYSQEAVDALLDNADESQKFATSPLYSTSYSAVTPKDEQVKQPTIIYVMDESYWDVSELEQYGITFDTDVSKNLHALQQTSAYGRAYSPSFGGGTCDVEFEALTGYSVSFLPSGSKPYQQHVTKPMFAMPNYLKLKGYQTAAVHCFWAKYWSRDKAYPNLGFDDFISLEDMHGVTKVRKHYWTNGLVTDDSMADLKDVLVPTTSEVLWGVINGDILSTLWQKITANTDSLLSLGLRQVGNLVGEPYASIFRYIGGGATYVCYVNGSQVAFTTNVKYPVLVGGVAARRETTGSVRTMVQLMPMKIDQVGAASVMSNGTRFEMADDAQVYLWYKGQYYATKLTEVNSEGYYLTGWYDNFGCAAGKRVRVIVAVKKD